MLHLQLQSGDLISYSMEMNRRKHGQLCIGLFTARNRQIRKLVGFHRFLLWTSKGEGSPRDSFTW